MYESNSTLDAKIMWTTMERNNLDKCSRVDCYVFSLTWIAYMGDIRNVFSFIKCWHFNCILHRGFGFATASWVYVGFSDVFAHYYIENGSFAAKYYKNIEWLQHIDDIGHIPEKN